jgi:hypothetical protein
MEVDVAALRMIALPEVSFFRWRFVAAKELVFMARVYAGADIQ